jgi:hypothetical protein
MLRTSVRTIKGFNTIDARYKHEDTAIYCFRNR